MLSLLYVALSDTSCYVKYGDGYCNPYRNLPSAQGGAYKEPTTDTNDPFYHTDPVIQCYMRCTAAFGLTKALYVDSRDDGCNCCGESNQDISGYTAGSPYVAYDMEGCGPPAPPTPPPPQPMAPICWTKRANGYCTAIRNLPTAQGGAYVAPTYDPTDPFYNPDPVVQCFSRCSAAYGPQGVIFLDSRDNGCNCCGEDSQDISTMAFTADGGGIYQSYGTSGCISPPGLPPTPPSEPPSTPPLPIPTTDAGGDAGEVARLSVDPGGEVHLQRGGRLTLGQI